MSPYETLPPRIAEARALAAALDSPGERILCTTLGRAQAAMALAAQRSEARVVCWFLDQHQQRLAASASEPRPNLLLELSADAPPDQFDLAVIPLSRRGEAELARDLLQSACQRLELGGTLVTAVDNPADRWLRAQLGASFDKTRMASHDDATVYVARKTEEPRKWKTYRCEFAFRDHGRLLRVVSRPGVFSHRHVDPGARRLLAAAEPPTGARILDIGCGSGVVGLALAARDPHCQVHAVDSHARAVQCAREGAELNGLRNLTVELNATGEYGKPSIYDLALANPPYYGDFKIAERFVDAAHRSLKPRDGRVLIVTKWPLWYQECMAELDRLRNLGQQKLRDRVSNESVVVALELRAHAHCHADIRQEILPAAGGR
jgi:16S rRNA (guanine1207-N2)-methyltransferase